MEGRSQAIGVEVRTNLSPGAGGPLAARRVDLGGDAPISGMGAEATAIKPSRSAPTNGARNAMVKGVRPTPGQDVLVSPTDGAATGQPPPRGASTAAPPTKPSSPVAVSPRITEIHSPPGGGYVIGGQRPSPPRKP